MSRMPIVINNFLSEEDIDSFLKYIEKNLHNFNNNKDMIYSMYTGFDYHHNFETKFNDPMLDDVRDLIIKYSKKIEKLANENFKSENKIYFGQWWMVKRMSGFFSKLHTDNDDGKNPHITHSGTLYLNTIGQSGELIFPDLNYIYHPKAGDLVLFRSDDLHGVISSRVDRYAMPIFMVEDEKYKLVK